MNSPFYKKLIESNQTWVATKLAIDSGYFQKMAKG
jgi:hypothetical protein